MGLPRKYWGKVMMKKEKKKTTTSTTTTTTTTDIPNDVMVEIFSRLPVHSLLRLKRVCKSWFNLIRDPSFVYMQLNYNINHTSNNNNNNPLVLIYSHDTSHHNLQLHSYNIMDDEEDHTLRSSRLVKAKAPSIKYSLHGFKILGSCNGLLCIVVSTSHRCKHDRFFIWNPCTKEYKKVTDGPSGINGYSKYGFGYDHTINDYKLVKNTYDVDNRETHVYVYSLGTSSWKTLSCYPFQFSNREEDNGLCINGHLYYTAEKMSRPFDIIVSFDIVKEEYQQIAMPDIYKGAYSFSVKLGELKGCLCLISNEFYFREFPEVWMMKHSFNDIHMKEEYSWEKLYTISTQEKLRSWNIKPLRFCKNGEMVMLMDALDGKKIVLYDPKSNKITSLRKVSKEEKVETYRESLVSLNSGTYMSQLCKHTQKPLDPRLVTQESRLIGSYLIQIFKSIEGQ